jgi:hypothetical protein
VTDTVKVQLATAPTGTTVVRIVPSDNRICLASADSRFAAADPSCPVGGTTYTLTFNGTLGNWNLPVSLTVRARNDFVAQDPRSTTLEMRIFSSPDPLYMTPALAIVKRIDAQSIDDETPGVFLLESAGRTLVQCGSTCGAAGTGDSYTVA